MPIFKKRDSKVEDSKSDYARIKVSNGGDFSMSSKDIFNDPEESLKLIKEFKKSVKSFNNRRSEADVRGGAQVQFRKGAPNRPLSVRPRGSDSIPNIPLKRK